MESPHYPSLHPGLPGPLSRTSRSRLISTPVRGIESETATYDIDAELYRGSQLFTRASYLWPPITGTLLPRKFSVSYPSRLEEWLQQPPFIGEQPLSPGVSDLRILEIIQQLAPRDGVQLPYKRLAEETIDPIRLELPSETDSQLTKTDGLYRAVSDIAATTSYGAPVGPPLSHQGYNSRQTGPHDNSLRARSCYELLDAASKCLQKVREVVTVWHSNGRPAHQLKSVLSAVICLLEDTSYLGIVHQPQHGVYGPQPPYSGNSVSTGSFSQSASNGGSNKAGKQPARNDFEGGQLSPTVILSPSSKGSSIILYRCPYHFIHGPGVECDKKYQYPRSLINHLRAKHKFHFFDCGNYFFAEENAA